MSNFTAANAMKHLHVFTNKMRRTRPIEAVQDVRRKSVTVSHLARCLTTLDLTSLGVGSCVGTGMYVVSGLVAKEMAGPAVIISFIIAGLASLLSGMCYAEFGVRVPKTSGSAYTYSYVTVGEFTAFFIGWNLILEYLIGTASGASALSHMLDSLTNRTIGEYMVKHLGNLPSIGGNTDPNSYPDILAMMIGIAMTVIVAAGVRNSVTLNNALNVINAIVWVFIVITGLFFLNLENWTGGEGFFPHGWNGVMRGAATCFYAYIGFDIIATTGEECKNPYKSIPRAILSSLVVCLTAYVTISVVLTLVVPFHAINSESPLVDMFNFTSFPQAKYVIMVGGISSLTVSLLGSLFPMPRVIYAMAKDGLLFGFLGRIFSYTETPLIATLISGIVAAILAMAVSLRDLIEMMSIGTLLAYTLVSVSILLLRYHPDPIKSESLHFRDATTNLEPHQMVEETINPEDVETMESEEIEYCRNESDSTGLMKEKKAKQSYGTIREGVPSNMEHAVGSLTDKFKPIKDRIKQKCGQLYNFMKPYVFVVRTWLGIPSDDIIATTESSQRATNAITVLCAYLFIFNIFLVFGGHHLYAMAWWSIIVLIVFLLGVAAIILRICQQPQSKIKLEYMAPGVPVLPICAVWFNTYLMLRLSPLTWIRFAIWCIIGLFMYFGYGIWNSGLETISSPQSETYQEGSSVDYVDVEKQAAAHQIRLKIREDKTVHEHLAKAEAILTNNSDAENLILSDDSSFGVADGE